MDVHGIGLVDTDNSLAKARPYQPGTSVRDSIAPASDVDVFRVDAAAVPLPPQQQGGTETLDRETLGTSSAPHLVLFVEVRGEGNWRPRVRFYNSSAKLLQDETDQNVVITYPLDVETMGSTFLVAISSDEKRNFDLITATGEGGGRGGSYTFAVKKVWQERLQKIPILP